MTSEQAELSLDAAIAEELRALLARRRVSARSISDKLGWGQMYLSRRLSGRVPFSAGELYKLAGLLGVPITSLLPPGVSLQRLLERAA